MKYYAIRQGYKKDIIVQSWDECSALVTGYSGAEFKSFKDFGLAEQYLNVKRVKRTVKVKKKQVDRPKMVNRTFDLDTYSMDSSGKGDCLHRGMFMGKNRCLIRDFGKTTGVKFKPHIGTRPPFEPDDLNTYKQY